jgi:hypothetical protein
LASITPTVTSLPSGPFDPAFFGGRAVEHLHHVEPFFGGDDAQPDPREAPFDLLVEPFQRFRREVVAEAILVAFAQLADHPLQGGVAELGVADLAEVVVLDHFRGFGDQAGRFFGERFAGEAGQLRGVAAEPDPGDQEGDQGDREGDRAAGPHAALRPAGSGAA